MKRRALLAAVGGLAVGGLAVASLAQARTSAAASPDDHRQARDALERQASLKRVLFSGGRSPWLIYRGVERRLLRAREAKDARLAQLYRRAAEDNFVRFGFSGFSRATFAAGLSQAALDLVDVQVAKDAAMVDRANLAWLKEALAIHGWFKISTDGAGADSAAWLLAQHADADPVFQQQVLDLLKPLAASGESDPGNYAYLYDRVAVAARRPQRYATQGSCFGPGDWRPDPLEDAAEVDSLREAVGIGPLAAYRVEMNRLCR